MGDFPPESADRSYQHLISKWCCVNPCKLPVVRRRATHDEDVCYEFVGETMNGGCQIRSKPSVRRRLRWSVLGHCYEYDVCVFFDAAREHSKQVDSVRKKRPPRR